MCGADTAEVEGWLGGGLLSEAGRFGAGLIGWASPPSRGPGESSWAWALGAGTCWGKNTWGQLHLEVGTPVGCHA